LGEIEYEKQQYFNHNTVSGYGCFFTSHIHDAHACSCAAPTDYLAAMAESEYAFTGTVTHIDNSLGPQKIHFDVSSVAKGNIPENTFVLENRNIINNGESSTQSSCDVGYKLELGK